MELTQDELIDHLRELGRAEVTLEGTNMKAARSRLIGAAKFVGVRVSVKRDEDKGVAIATVLTADEAVVQARRGARFRAARLLKDALAILDTELDDKGKEEDADLIFDLREMLGELEEG